MMRVKAVVIKKIALSQIKGLIVIKEADCALQNIKKFVARVRLRRARVHLWRNCDNDRLHLRLAAERKITHGDGPFTVVPPPHDEALAVEDGMQPLLRLRQRQR